MKALVDGVAGFIVLLGLAVLVGSILGWLVVKVLTAAVGWFDVEGT